MVQYVRNVLIAFDQLLNAISFGDPDETISSRVGKAADRGNFPAHVAAHVIELFMGKGHCHNAEEADEGNEGVF